MERESPDGILVGLGWALLFSFLRDDHDRRRHDEEIWFIDVGLTRLKTATIGEASILV